ncbi:PREDICTED: heterogeneous nuclear ribonucleoprotein F isoform X2 [Tarenaya hassleriana]|nr:PREDICTED: heterogeneous nuclear ribonucleoprotein F isoform X2 [Tarenaya hassleriana]
MGPKRQRMIDQGPSFYGPHPGSGFVYNPYAFTAAAPFPVVRLRGLPFNCTELDVVEFFRGLDVVDILFVHKNHKFTGEAFCVLGYPLQIDFALQKNRQNMGRRYVEVFRSKKQEYYMAIANEVAETRGSGSGSGGGGSGGRGGGSPRTSGQRAKSHDDSKESADEYTGILRLRGLPFSAGKEDILDFFKDFDLSEDSIHITVNAEGRPTGEAYVEFVNPEESRAAMVKDRKTLGSRYIELFPSSHEELEEAISRGR